MRQDVVGKIMSGADADRHWVGRRLPRSLGRAPWRVRSAGRGCAAPAAAPAAEPAATTWRPGSTRVNCTACDECTKLNSKIFAYNADKKAVIKNAEAGPYNDLVKAAERCTARVIHPGCRETGAKRWLRAGGSSALAWCISRPGRR